MPPPIPVILAPYDPNWPRIAARYADDLRVIGECLVTVHHIGSTSVPGLAAKPIIDLMPLVTDLSALEAQRPRLEALEYRWHGEYGIPERRYCTLSDAAGHRRVHAHFFVAGSAQVARHLAFRDYLRTHPEIAEAYEIEKRRAQALHPNDSHSYTNAKAAWIAATETKALAWASTG